MKIGMIGKGRVGTALGRGLESAGHDIKYGHRDPNERVADAAEFGEVLILAVPFSQVKNVIREMEGKGDGKTIIDVTNLTGPEEMALGGNTSGAEELQKLVPKAKVVKAFNYAFAQNMPGGKVKGRQLTAFVAGNDEEAKEKAMTLAGDIGFLPVDSGNLEAARNLESLGRMLMDLAFKVGLGKDIGFDLIK